MLIPKLYIFNPGFSLSYMEQIGAYLVCGSWQLEARWGGGWVEATFANFNSISSPGFPFTPRISHCHKS